MKKLILFVFILLNCVVTVFAAAPELKNMMPNSWEKLIRLNSEEEKLFFEIEALKEDLEVRKKYFDKKRNKEIDLRIYSENCNDLSFYRVLYCNEKFDTFLNTEYKNCIISQNKYMYLQDIEMFQSLFIKEKNNKFRFIGGTSYHDSWVSQGEWEGFNFSDIMIKQLNKQEIGFFVTEAIVSYKIDRINNDKLNVIYRTVKNQQVGLSKASFTKYNIKDEINTIINNDSISIEASDYLFDPKCPFKYSIQNAFDGNPATSYVENTEDDLMKVEVWLGQVVDRMGIINGYAQSNELYNSNNRIKQIENYFELEDNKLSYQFIPCRGTNISFTSFYKGNKYNDTCIAEINYFLDKKWFFGDIQ